MTSLNSRYVPWPLTVLSVTSSQAIGLRSLIVPWIKIHLAKVLLATSIAELGIKHTKGPSGLGKAL